MHQINGASTGWPHNALHAFTSIIIIICISSAPVLRVWLCTPKA